jgi:hypothetical protein
VAVVWVCSYSAGETMPSEEWRRKEKRGDRIPGVPLMKRILRMENATSLSQRRQSASGGKLIHQRAPVMVAP